MSQPQAASNRPLPHSVEAERSVLGGVLLDNEVLSDLSGRLQPQDFFRRAHARIWQAMLDLGAENRPVDLVTLTERLKEQNLLDDVGGLEYLAGLDTDVPTAAHAEQYARIVRDRAVLRRLVQAAESILSEGMAGPGDLRDFIDEAESRVFQITQEQDERQLTPLKEVALRVFGILEQRFESRSEITGVPTGYIDLDKITAGLQRGDLIILAARPSMGKTAFALNLCANAALHGEKAKVAIFSLEMSTDSLVMRMLSSEARVRADQLRTGQLSASAWPKLAAGAASLSEADIYIDDTPAISLNEVRSKARRMKAKVGLDLIVVDYLQLMRGPKSDSREQEISSISRGLKGLAKDLDVPVIALSQLNRSLERRENKRPQLSDLRESGAIEQDADVIMFIHREDRYRQGAEPSEGEKDGVAEIIIAKQRNGPTGTIELVFFDEYTRFDNFERHGP
jgi:replicative DNA helicase